MVNGRRGLRLLLLVVGFCFGVAPTSAAVPIRVDFTGRIDVVDDPNGLLPDGIAVGTPFSGTYAFDSIPPAGTPREIRPGFYSHGASPISFLVLSVGGNNFSVLFTAFDLSSSGATSLAGGSISTVRSEPEPEPEPEPAMLLGLGFVIVATERRRRVLDSD